ncbi:uncharacterized protein EV420DRAFT_1497233 [Desarmillaria tabescens]|uniref:Uncharacterized protein n=1 Tax=Armillaria tabescens TaxID=1929756 RepID=A0AA39U8U8_ARMTA|nr:uncharacterized protein EV420DRAFT_1497233 [Desarmillaria tabescens]KAK0469875.1 hypothetical protein EV420DRAFT_1497233 [Desarmillaria tabescens]
MSTSIAFTPSVISSFPTCNKRLFSTSDITPATPEDEPPYKKQCKRASMSGLRRTRSFLSLSDLPRQEDLQQSMYLPQSRGRSRGRGRKMSMSLAEGDFRACLEASIASSLAPITHPYSSAQRPHAFSPERIASSSYTSAPRVSSPLCPSRRPSFIFTSSTPRPRKGKCEPDLHRIAIQTCMRSTSEGQKILAMGPRLAMNIVYATRELERMVKERGLEIFDKRIEEDITMVDSTTEPWINVSGERTGDDWEMINCGA